MTRRMIALACSALIFWPASVSAACGGDLCVDVQITRIYINGSTTYLRTSGNEDLLTCDPGSGDYLRMRRSAGEYEDWYALVLTAFAQEVPITFKLESGTGTCYVQYIYQDR